MLRRQKHVPSQSTTPFACTLQIGKRFNRSLVRTGFGAGFEIALEPSELQKEGENPGKGRFYFLRQTLVCTKPWFQRDLNRCASVSQGSKGGGVSHHSGVLRTSLKKLRATWALRLQHLEGLKALLCIAAPVFEGLEGDVPQMLSSLGKRDKMCLDAFLRQLSSFSGTTKGVPFQDLQKGINIQNFARTPPPPSQEPPPPYSKKSYIKNFEGGGLGGPNSLC